MEPKTQIGGDKLVMGFGKPVSNKRKISFGNLAVASAKRPTIEEIVPVADRVCSACDKKKAEVDFSDDEWSKFTWTGKDGGGTFVGSCQVPSMKLANVTDQDASLACRPL